MFMFMNVLVNFRIIILTTDVKENIETVIGRQKEAIVSRCLLYLHLSRKTKQKRCACSEEGKRECCV